MAILETRDTPLNNELTPFLITDPAELAIYDLLMLRGGAWWAPKPVSMEGLPGSPLAFAWKDHRRLLKASPSIAGVAPLVLDDGRSFLRMGYGGALTYTSSGALETPNGIDVWTGPSVSMFAVFRVPSTGGAAGASPGGALVGNMRSQTDAFSPASNPTWTGLQVGYGTNGTEELRFCVNGDAMYTDVPGILDHEDGLWKVGGGIFHSSAQTMEVRLNGTSLLKTTTNASGDPANNVAISTLAGARRIRIGATGAPNASSLTNTFRGDMGDVLVFGSVLTPAEISVVKSYLLAKYPLT